MSVEASSYYCGECNAIHTPDRTPDPLTDETVVDFDGELARFGDLMMQDRKTVTWDAQHGRYTGGYGY